MVGSPSHSISPPLVCDFMRHDLLHKPVELAVYISEQHPALRRIGVCRNWEVHKVRPGLPKVEVRLFSNIDLVQRNLAEEKAAQLQLSARLLQGVGSHLLRSQIGRAPV